MLLEALQKNGRASYKQLSEVAGVSPSTCLERVRGLHARGILTGFRAEVDLPSLGRSLQAIIAVRFRTHERALADAFVDYVLGLQETVGVFNVSGDDDYLLHVAVADPEDLRSFVLDRLGTRAEIEHVRTSLVYRHLRSTAVVPVAESA